MMGTVIGIVMWMLLVTAIVFSGAFAYQGVVQNDPATALVGCVGVCIFLAFGAMGSRS